MTNNCRSSTLIWDDVPKSGKTISVHYVPNILEDIFFRYFCSFIELNYPIFEF